MTESAWDKHNREQLKRIIDREKQRRARQQAHIEERKALRGEIRITPVRSPFHRFVELFRGETQQRDEDDIQIFRM